LADELFDFLFSGNTQKAARPIKTIQSNVSSGIDTSTKAPKDDLFEYLFAEKPQVQDDIPQPIQETIQEPEPIFNEPPSVEQTPIGITPQLQTEVPGTTRVDIGTPQQPITSDPNKIFGTEGGLSVEQETPKVQPLKALAEGAKQTAKAFGGMFKGIGEVVAKQYKDAIDIEKANLQPGETSEHLSKLQENYDFTQSVGEVGEKILKTKILKPDETFKKSPGIIGYIQDVIMVAPQIAGTVAAATIGGPGAGFAFAGSQIAGSKYQQLTEEGVNPERAFIASIGDAALQAPLEMIGIGKALKVFKPGKIAGKAIKEIIEAGATEFVTETIQKYPEAITEIWAKTEGKSNQERTDQFIDNFWEITKAGIKEGLVAAPFGVGISSVGVGLKTASEKAVKKTTPPEEQIAPSGDIQDQPIDNLPDVTDEVLSPPVQSVIDESVKAKKEHEASIKNELKTLKKNVESGVDLEINQLKAIKEDYETTGFPKTKKMFKQYWEGLTGDVLTNEEASEKLKQVIGSIPDIETASQIQPIKEPLSKVKPVKEEKPGVGTIIEEPIPEVEKTIAEPVKIEPEKTVKEKVNETLIEKGIIEDEKPVKKEVEKVEEQVEAKTVLIDKIDGISLKDYNESINATLKNPSRNNITNLVSNILHPYNKKIRKKFEDEQGVKLPDTGKIKDVDDTKKLLQDWAKSKKESKVAKVEGQEVDIAPTEAQKEAGNYKVAHVKRDGMEISIENPAGSVRSGTDKDGETWSQEMKLDYGYIRGTKGYDKDHVDMFIKPGAKEGGKVFVVNQVDPKTKNFDEHKAIVGVETEQQALDAYNSNYEKGWKGAGSVVEMSTDEFKEWVRSDAPSKGEVKPIDKDTPVEGKQPYEMTKSDMKRRLTKSEIKEIINIEKSEPKSKSDTVLTYGEYKGQRVVKGGIHSDTWRIQPKISELVNHKIQVEKALKEGKTVPPEVLKDFPDLKVTKEVKPVEEKKQAASTIKINDGTKEIEIARGTKVKKGVKTGEIVGFRNVGGKYFSRFKDDKTGKVELVPLKTRFELVDKHIAPYEKTKSQWELENIKVSGIIYAPLKWGSLAPKESPAYLPTPDSNPKYGFKINNLNSVLRQKVMLPNGKIYEYKGISAHKVDNINRINGWEEVTGNILKTVEHKESIKKAIEEGKTVPPEVLKDFPDLKVTKEVKPVEEKKQAASTIKINDGTKEIEIERVTKVKKGTKTGEIVGSRNIKDKYFTRFKDDKTGKVELVPLKTKLEPISKQKKEDVKGKKPYITKYSDSSDFIKDITEGIKYEHKKTDYTKSTREEINKERKNYEERTNSYYNGVSQEKQKIVDEREYVDFASKLRQNISKVISGNQFEHVKGVINKDKKGNLITRDEHTEKQLQAYAESWNIAKTEGEGSTVNIVPPQSILQTIDNWTTDDVVDILRDGLNQKDQIIFHNKLISKEEKIDEDYEKELDYLIQTANDIEKQSDNIDMSKGGYPSDWDTQPSESTPEETTTKIVEELGTKPNQLDITKLPKKPITPGIQASESLPSKETPIVPTDQKGETNEQQRVADVIDTVKNSKAKTSAERNKQAKAISALGKQVQHNPGGKKKGSGWLTTSENAYFQVKESAWPIIKIRKILEKLGVSKNRLLEGIDYGIDAVRGADTAAQQYIKDNYEPIFTPLKDFSMKDRGKTGRALSRYLVAKRTEWLYDNKDKYYDDGISLDVAIENVKYIENGDHPNSNIILEMANNIWAYNKGLIKIKYENGVIDKDLLDNLKEPYYVPHYRDVESGIKNPIKIGLTTTSTGIKRIKGSESGRMIIDPLQLMISTTQETIVNAAKAKLMQNVIAIAEEHPEVFDNLITQYTNPPRKAGSIEHRMQVDEYLRDKINEFAEKYGYDVKTSAKLRSRRLGQFDSFNQEIRILYGATEGVRAHELGHGIDHKVPWVSKILSDNNFKHEMNAIADSRYEGEEVPQRFVRYVRQLDEKIAEFFSLYLTNRPMLNKLAPNALAAFENKLESDPKLKDIKGIVPSNVKKMESFLEDNWVADNSIPQDEDVISLRKDGKLVHYRVPLEMAQAVKSLSPRQLPEWLKWVLVVPTTGLRFGAVGGNIGFAIPNFTRDQVDAAFNTKSIPFVDWFIGANHYIRQDEVYKLYNRMGGGMNSPESGIAGSKKGYSGIVYGSQGGQFLDPFYWKNRGHFKGTKEISWYGIKTSFQPILSLIALSEAGTRIGVFHRDLKSSGINLNNLKAKDAQFVIKQAVHAARHSSADFNRFGYSGVVPNQIMPFTNAALEGIDRFARSWVVPIQEGRLPIRPIMVTGLTFMVYAGLLAWNRRNEWYKKIPSKEKSDNWIIMDNDTDQGYKKIPKGHTTKLIINPFQMIYEKINGLSQTTGWGIAVDIFSGISPINQASIIPVSLKLIIEPIADYDFYWQSTIEKPSQKTWPKGMRSRSSTSETLKSIGKALNISPDMMQHEVRVAFGGLGRDILWLTDWALGTAGVQKPPNFELENAVIVKRFVGKAEEWKSDASSRIRTINKRISEIKKGGKNARIVKMRRDGASKKEIYDAIKASRIEMIKLIEKRKELEIAGRNADSLKNKALNRGIKLK